MTTTTTMKIKIPVGFMDVKSVKEAAALVGGDEVLVEIFKRYFCTQEHAVKYRTKAAITAKLLKERFGHLLDDESAAGLGGTRVALSAGAQVTQEDEG